MRVLFVCEREYLPDLVTGMGRNTQALCRRLDRLGVTTAVLAKLTPRGLTNFGHRLSRKLLPSSRRAADRVAGHRTYRVWSIREEIDAVLNSFPASVAVVQDNVRRGLVDLFLNRGIPVIFYHHIVDWNPATPLRQHEFLSVIACSQFVADRFHSEQGHPVSVVPPLVEAADYRTKTTRQEVLFVNPRPEKGDDIAWALAKARPDIRFRFVEAWSPSKAEHDENLRRARQAGNVTLETSKRDMRPFYAKARLVLAPSRCAEAFGRVIAEAQISGIPALCSNLGGHPEAAGAGAILLPFEDDPGNWITALNQIWTDYALYQHLAQQALQHAQRPEFAPEQVTANFLGHLERACALRR